MAEELHLRREIKRYAEHLASGIRSPRRRREVAAEYADHLEDLVLSHMVAGMTEGEAFRLAREELGDSVKITELENAVYNRDPLPTLVTVLLWLLGGAAVISTYYLFDNDFYRAWFAFLCNMAVLALELSLLYTVYLFLRALRVRYVGLKRLTEYARENGMTLQRNARPLLSVFRRSRIPELTLFTAHTAYHLYLWATVRRRKSLYLYDCGLYSYSDHVGYMMLYTRNAALFGPAVFWPSNVRFFPTFHSEHVEVPRGMHLTPGMNFEGVAHPEKENVNVLLLNPIPFHVYGVTSGVKRELGDDAHFSGMRIWSFTGLISYLEGLRISGRRYIG